jgi:hypothetical protein
MDWLRDLFERLKNRRKVHVTFRNVVAEHSVSVTFKRDNAREN